MGDAPVLNDARLVAAYDMLRRTGAQAVQLRYSDDEQPVVWFAVAVYGSHHLAEGCDGCDDPGHRVPVAETAAALGPERAVLRLCEQLIDGAQCVHCQHPTSFYPDVADTVAEDLVGICVYMWDPELATFRRGCE